MAGFVTKIAHSGLGILTSRVFGMIRDVAIAAIFGASGLTDAFFVAFALPNLFRAFFAEGALSSVFIPFLSDKMKNDGEKAASGFLTSLILAVSLQVIFLLIFVFIFPDFITKTFMPGYSGTAHLFNIASRMVVILMPFLLFISISALLSCYLNLKHSYFTPNSSTTILNITMITGAVVGYFNNFDIFYLCYGVITGGILQVLFLLVSAFKKGYRFRLNGGYDRDVNKLFYLIFPSIAGVGISQVNFMIGRIMASFLTSGSISYLYFANRLFQLPLGMFAVAVGTVTLSEISMVNSSHEYEKRNVLIDKAINAIFLVMLPAVFGLVLLADPIINLIYGHHNFKLHDVHQTAYALQAYTVGLMFYSFLSIFSRIFYSDKDVKTPLVGAVYGLIINVILNYLLMYRMGHSGIALSASIAALVNCSYLYFNLKDYKYRFGAFKTYVLKIVASVFVMSVVIFFMNMVHVHVILTILSGCAVYFGVLFMSGINIKKVLR